MGRCVCTPCYACGIQGTTWRRWFLSLYNVDYRDWTQVFRFGIESLYFLSHLISPLTHVSSQYLIWIYQVAKIKKKKFKEQTDKSTLLFGSKWVHWLLLQFCDQISDRTTLRFIVSHSFLQTLVHTAGNIGSRSGSVQQEEIIHNMRRQTETSKGHDLQRAAPSDTLPWTNPLPLQGRVYIFLKLESQTLNSIQNMSQGVGWLDLSKL